jgi:predicted extracellular nuclease
MTKKNSQNLSVLLIVGLLLAFSISGICTADAQVSINEIRIDQPSTDNDEYFELVGDPGTSLDGLAYLVIGDGTDGSGVIEAVVDLAGESIPASGFFVVAESTFSLGAADLSTNLNFENSDNVTHLLVEGFTGSEGDDLDVDDDGILDNTPWGAIVDLIALVEEENPPSATEYHYGPPDIGPDGPFVPGHVFRLPDGSGDFQIGEFAPAGGDDTPGAANTFDDEPAELVDICNIQGAGHISPFLVDPVDRTEERDPDSDALEAYNSVKRFQTMGYVTAIAFNGIYLQDPNCDENDNTSDAIFVLKFGSKPDVGAYISVVGTISEFFPGNADTGNLSITQLTGVGDEDIEVITPPDGSVPPEPVIIGQGGRIPPNVLVISPDEEPVNLQDPEAAAINPFNPETDGIDFYESLEGMLVTVEEPVTVSATRTFNTFSSEFFALANNGADVAPDDARTDRGGILLQPDPDNRGDQNPERVQIQIDGTLYPGDVPAISVGTPIGDVKGVVGYSFGNFEINATELFDSDPSTIEPETTDLVGIRKKVTVASYNVLNLSPLTEDDNQRATIASQIVNNLRSPDVIALQEIQDNSGETDDGTTDASETLQALVDAIIGAGGPRYKFFDVAPEEGTSGGVPGGNIRNAFLYNPKRVKLLFYYSLTPKVLEFFRISNPDAFSGTRNPLVAKFWFKGRTFTVINNHLTSRFGSTPIFGGPQPFVQAGEDEREAQCLALHQVVRKMKRFNRHARIMVLGDLNTFEWTNDLTDILPGVGYKRILSNLIDTIKDDNAYTFIFDGNSQVLDHVFVTDNLLPGAEIDIVHVNVDFPRVDDSVGSDHEPVVTRLNLHHTYPHDEDKDDKEEDDE